MTAANWYGLALGATGAFGMWVAGRGSWKGWAIGLATQPLWVAFFISVGSWTGLLVPGLYGSVYARNLWRWRAQATKERGGEEAENL